MPRPNAEWRFSTRSSTTLSASGNISGSRLAAGNGRSSQSPSFIGQPSKSKSLDDEAGHRDRRVRTEELLHRGVHERGLGREALAVFGVLGEVPERRADRRPRGVDAGDHEQDHRAAHVVGVELLAVELRVEQERREVVLRVRDVLGDAVVEVAVELALVLLRLALLGRRVDVFDDHADEAAEDVGVFGGEAEHLHDHAHRDVLRVLERGVERRLAGRSRRAARCRARACTARARRSAWARTREGAAAGRAGGTAGRT